MPLLAGAAVVALLAVPASAQAAPDGVTCDGRVDGDVAGDLHVPAGAGCAVVGGVVTGDAVVAAGATLGLERAAVRGDLVAGGWVTTVSSTVKGDVVLREGGRLRWSSVYGGIRLTGRDTSLTLDDVTVRRSVRGTAAEVTVRDSHVEGAVNVTGTGTQAYARNPVTIVGSEVGGWVDLERTQTWLSLSEVHRGFTARRAFDVRMCRATIAGDLTIQDTRLETDHRGIPDNGIVIGSPGVCGAPSADVPSVVVGGTVRLLRNTALGVEIQDAAVDGDLVCRENAGELGPGVTVRDVVVGGQRLGQCA